MQLALMQPHVMRTYKIDDRDGIAGRNWAAWAVCGVALVAFALSVTLGCRTGKSASTENKEYFTSGSREADQRAQQRMAKAEQLSGSGEGAGEKGKKKEVAVLSGAEESGKGSTNKMLKVAGKQALYERLGGELGISNLVADVTPRLLDDPRVNWDRKGVKRGGFSFRAGESVTWKPEEHNVELLQKHLVQFLALATGGPAEYQGKEIKQTHADMHIDNPEFDAAVGDLKATLDRLKVPNQEQKELLAIVESTRPEIVTER